MTIEPTIVGGMKGFVLTPKETPEAHKGQVVYNIHGGGYVYGPGESGTAEAMLMAAYGGYRVTGVDYRMPPDGTLSHRHGRRRRGLRGHHRRHRPEEGRGGGHLDGRRRDAGADAAAEDGRRDVPGALAPGTPWSDMTETGDTYRTNAWVDNGLVSYNGYLTHAAQLYAAGHDLKDPQLSPIYGDFHGLPPTVLTSGTRDVFLSNTVRTQQKLREAGVVQELQVCEGISHAQYLFDAQSPLTKEVFGEYGRFFDGHLAK